jgi:hypothetical protein
LFPQLIRKKVPASNKPVLTGAGSSPEKLARFLRKKHTMSAEGQGNITAAQCKRSAVQTKVKVRH